MFKDLKENVNKRRYKRKPNRTSMTEKYVIQNENFTE